MSFGGKKYGYIDHRLLLHYLPWEYASVKAAKGALLRFSREGKAGTSWFVRLGDKVSTIDFFE